MYGFYLYGRWLVCPVCSGGGGGIGSTIFLHSLCSCVVVLLQDVPCWSIYYVYQPMSSIDHPIVSETIDRIILALDCISMIYMTVTIDVWPHGIFHSFG